MVISIMDNAVPGIMLATHCAKVHDIEGSELGRCISL